MNIQWYPGHMTKARRQMQDDLKLIDLLIEIIDARIPLSSRNPDIDKMGQNKYRLILLNKADLADPAANKEWLAYFRKKGYFAEELDARTPSGVKKLNATIAEIVKEKTERDRKRGILNRPVRAMIAGIPNVGKSTFINSFAGRTAAKTGNKPGVTRANQWIRIRNSIELLDTPGILWPRFDDQKTGLHLALIGSINDDILDSAELALEGIKLISEIAPEAITARYGIELAPAPLETLENIGRARGALKKGAEVDYDKAGKLFLDDLKSGRMGRISLERP